MYGGLFLQSLCFMSKVQWKRFRGIMMQQCRRRLLYLLFSHLILFCFHYSSWKKKRYPLPSNLFIEHSPRSWSPNSRPPAQPCSQTKQSSGSTQPARRFNNKTRQFISLSQSRLDALETDNKRFDSWDLILFVGLNYLNWSILPNHQQTINVALPTVVNYFKILQHEDSTSLVKTIDKNQHESIISQ